MTSFGIKDYDMFDPDGTWTRSVYCGDCTKGHCFKYPFASYDDDNDQLEFVTTPATGNQPEFKWYKKRGTTDSVAKKPYKYMEAPCCYTLTIDGVVNKSIDVSWCRDCNHVNGTYSNIDAGSGGSNNIIFYLCSLQGFNEREYPSGLKDERYFTAPCRIYRFEVEVYLDTNSPPNIVAEGKLYADNSFYYRRSGYTGSEGYNSVDRIVVCWKKTIVVYDGQSSISGNRSYPLGVGLGDFGTYDGRLFNVEFTSSDLYIPSTYPDNEFPLLDGLCDFISATLTISPRDVTTTLTRSCYDKSTVSSSETEVYQFSKGKYLNDLCGSAYGYFNYVPNKLSITIGGITGIDDIVSDNNLTVNNCRKCANINNSFDLTYNSYLNIWEFNNDTRGPDTCCDCTSLSTCISDIHVYLDYVNGGTYYDVRITAEIKTGVYGTVATFVRHLGDVAPTAAGLRFLEFNGLSIDLDFVSQTYTGGLSPYEWQRCDFSSATVNVQFEAYNNIFIPCNRRSILCNYCSGKDRPQYLQVNFPTGGWSWGPSSMPIMFPGGNVTCLHYNWPNPSEFATINCDGTQLFEGSYILDNDCTADHSYYIGDCTWSYFDAGNDESGSITWGPNGCCPSCDPARGLYLTIYRTQNSDPLAPYYSATYDFLVELVCVVTIAGVAPNLLYPTWDCTCKFYWRGYVDSKSGSGIPLSNIPTSSINIWEGPYLDCEVDLNGLTLDFYLADCGTLLDGGLLHWDNYAFWIWNGSSVTLSSV